MTLIEMEGFLRGKCLPGDMLVSETNAQYLHRKLTAYEAMVANLEAQVQGLAAENSDLKHPGTYLPSKRETPNTDAALAEIRNEARAEGAELCVKALVTSDDDTFADAPNICAMVAFQLRKEQGK